MKALLVLPLLLFLNSVFSQSTKRCSFFGKCPDGYYKEYTGSTTLNSECYCKIQVRFNTCETSVEICKTSFGDSEECRDVEINCSTKEIISACGTLKAEIPELCDRASQKLLKEKYEQNQQVCENSKNDCIRLRGSSCNDVPRQCDPDTIVQLCKDGYIDSKDSCEAAEIQQEKDRAENTNYSCERADGFCRTGYWQRRCLEIPKFCDVQTVAKWCYQDREKGREIASDEECSRVVKKSQDLMFGKSNEECWKHVPLCERGSPEDCMQVPNLCVKEVVSALCNANKMTSKRICKYAGSDKTTTPSHPGCGFFSEKCNYGENEYCSLASRYCDNDTIGGLCRTQKITDPSVCERVQANNSGASPPA